jgi:integrase
MIYKQSLVGWSACSNDDRFEKPRVRNAPIKSSMIHVDGLPTKLKIYRIAGSKYWQMRLFNQGKYITKSLKTTEVEEAKVYAKELFNEINSSGAYVVKVSKHRAMSELENQRLLHDLIKDICLAELEKVKRDEIKHASYVMSKIRLEGLVFEFFKNKPLNKIKVHHLAEFVDLLTAKALSASTMQGYIAQVRKVLRLLHTRGVLNEVPQFPSIKSNLNSRGAFTITEYKNILRKSKSLRAETFDWSTYDKAWIRSEYHQMSYEMNLLIRFMVYTFVRPGDIRQVKNKHIEIIRGKYNYLRLNLPEVKRHKAATVSLSAAVFIFEKVLAYQTSRGYGGPDDYVFFPEEKNRRLVLDIIGWSFNWILSDLNIKKGPHGIDRTFYSLRHTAITFRLIYGGNIDLLTLARNARTSVEMIEKFYASTLSAEMNIALLHSKRQ